MEISKATYKMSLSEEELKEAIEFYTKHKYSQEIKIKYLMHKVGSRTEGCDHMEIDIPYQEGVEFICE